MIEVTIGCIRTDRPPYNNPSHNIWWAYIIEDQCDGYGRTQEEAIGRVIMALADCYKGEDLPYIKQIILGN